MKLPQINDILYTKDGCKSGNLTCIHIEKSILTTNNYSVPITYYWFISDYGNIIKMSTFAIHLNTSLTKQFYSTYGTADPTHKYYDYIKHHPEELL